MSKPNRILAEYRNADFERRLYLFLEHRMLRDDFVKIDQLEQQCPPPRRKRSLWQKLAEWRPLVAKSALKS